MQLNLITNYIGSQGQLRNGTRLIYRFSNVFKPFFGFPKFRLKLNLLSLEKYVTESTELRHFDEYKANKSFKSVSLLAETLERVSHN